METFSIISELNPTQRAYLENLLAQGEKIAPGKKPEAMTPWERIEFEKIVTAVEEFLKTREVPIAEAASRYFEQFRGKITDSEVDALCDICIEANLKPEDVIFTKINGSVIRLFLDSLALRSIPSAVNRLSELMIFSAENNNIQDMDTEVFRGMANLHALKLSGNEIKKIPPIGAFSRKLNNLDLSKNPIDWNNPNNVIQMTFWRELLGPNFTISLTKR